MDKDRSRKFALMVMAALAVYFLLVVSRGLYFISGIPSGIVVTPENVSDASFGAFNCDLNVSEQVSGTPKSDKSKGKLTFKLFGLLPIRTIDVICEKERSVRLGGFPVGIGLNVDGVLVDEVGYVETGAGKVSVGDKIRSGDIILNLNDTKITTVADMLAFMNAYKGEGKLGVTLNRDGRVLAVSVSPLIDALSGNYRLGLWVRDTVSGVGTTSFVKSDNSFASLGHGITHNDRLLPITGGSVYNCDIVGVQPGAKGCPGELRGVLRDTSNPIGEVYSNTEYGVYGRYYDNAPIPEKYYKVGSRLNVRNGKAKIYTTVNGTADFYDIEIIRAVSQSSPSVKGMVIRITDKRLLELSGGVVRGMSGSPIIQNDMIVGAVTHVFVNDPTKGYGLYLDWMY